MKINYILDNNKVIKSWSNIPFDDNKPWIEIQNPNDINVDFDQIIDGKLINNSEKVKIYLEKLTKMNSIKERIEQLKKLLTESDYKAIKYFEGLISELDYKPIKDQRQLYRDEINKLEEELSLM